MTGVLDTCFITDSGIRATKETEIMTYKRERRLDDREGVLLPQKVKILTSTLFRISSMVVTTSSVSTVSRRHYNNILMLDKSQLKGLQHLLPYTYIPTFTALLAKK